MRLATTIVTTVARGCYTGEAARPARLIGQDSRPHRTSTTVPIADLASEISLEDTVSIAYREDTDWIGRRLRHLGSRSISVSVASCADQASAAAYSAPTG